MTFEKTTRRPASTERATGRAAACAEFAQSALLTLGLLSAACEPPLEDELFGGGGAVEPPSGCTISGVDYDAGDSNPATPCQRCDPASPHAWTTDESRCLVDGPCHAAGDDAGLGCTRVPPSDDVDLCPDGFPRGTTSDLRLVEAFSPSLEGVAVCPNGDVFVSQPETATIFRVALDGSPPEPWATLSGHQPLGMDCASDGSLYVADFGSNDASVFRIAAQGDAGTPLPTVPGGGGYHAMNGVAAVEGVGIYATDASNTLGGRIVLFTETSPGVFEASIVKAGLPFPNDVAFNPSSGKLDVTMTVNSQVFSYPVASDGTLGDLSITWSGTLVLDALDGITVAEADDRYIAHYLQGKVSRSSDWQTVANVTEPRSLAFRGGTLLITAKTGLYAIDLGVCGAR